MNKNLTLLGLLILLTSCSSIPPAPAAAPTAPTAAAAPDDGNCHTCGPQLSGTNERAFASFEGLEPTLPYTPQQYQRAADYVCNMVEKYKSDGIGGLGGFKEFKDGTINKNLTGMVRFSIKRVLRQKDYDQLESELETILNKLVDYPCQGKSIYALDHVPFHMYKRNFLKRAAFAGMDVNMFEEFLLEQVNCNEQKQCEDRIKIKLNTVEMINGKPETIVDYLDQMLDPSLYDASEGMHDTYLGRAMRGNIRRLRTSLLDRGAKRASELVQR